MLGRKTVLVPKTEMTLGEFDPSVDGAYRNVKTVPLDVRPKRSLYVKMESNIPVDLALSNTEGRCIGFKDQMTDGVFGPTPLMNRETIALMMGVFRGDLANITLEVWME